MQAANNFRSLEEFSIMSRDHIGPNGNVCKFFVLFETGRYRFFFFYEEGVEERTRFPIFVIPQSLEFLFQLLSYIQ